MTRDILHVVADIDALPTAEGDDLDRLQELIDEYFGMPAAADHLAVWFRLYERFPDDHGHGVFWSVLHGLESLPGYEAAVVESVRRRPTHYAVLMVNRMLNGDIRTAAGADLLGLLREVAGDARAEAGVRGDAEGYLEHQRARGAGG